jgi:integrase
MLGVDQMVGRRVLAKLTVKAVANLKRPGRHLDGYGLYLIVTHAGTKSYAFLYRREGRSHEMGLGSAITTTLADARQKAAQCRSLLAQGIDPLETRQTRVEARKNRRTFGECAVKLIASKRSAWRSHKHCEQWVTSLARPCALINERAVADIDTAVVLQVLQPLWTRTPETASRLRARIEAVLDYARAQDWRTGENPARWKGHLDAILPRRPKLAQPNHAALAYQDVPQFIRELRTREALASPALQFLILTAARLSEVTGATWAEMDLEAAVWTIPAGRMKAGREHRVPLAKAVLAILQDAAALRTSTVLVFPGRSRGRHLSAPAFRALLPSATLHGFRSSFSTWASEQTNFPREVVEQSLAHTIGNLAYRRTDWLERRRALMQQWADFLVPARPCEPSTLMEKVRI